MNKLEKFMHLGAAATGDVTACAYITAFFFVVYALVVGLQKQIAKEEREESCRKS